MEPSGSVAVLRADRLPADYGPGRVPAGAGDFDRPRHRTAQKRTAQKPHRRPRVYPLRCVLLCGLCDRRTTGNWNNDQAYYRCRFPAEYALANRVEHSKTVYLREAEVIGPLDTWLGRAFDPANLRATLNQLAAQAAVGNDDISARTEAAKARIVAFNSKIAQYRASLDAGGDPTVIGPWITEIQAQRVAAQAEIRSATGKRRMTRDEIAAIIAALGDLVQVIRDADPADKAELYARLGLTMTYRPQKRLVEATVMPSLHMCKGFVSEGRMHQKAIMVHHV
jgi:site-specific DNA recombinase